MDVTVERIGRRSYLRGNTYPIKDKLRAGGAKWDGEQRAWWVGSDEKARELAAIDDQPCGHSHVEEIGKNTPGEDAVVAGRAKYNGGTYYIAGKTIRGRTHYDDTVDAITTRDGKKFLLYFRDGSKRFWAEHTAVTVTKVYDRPKTIAGLKRFAERAKEAKAQGYEDGIPDGQRYECEECGEYVTRGQGSCWETGAPH